MSDAPPESSGRRPWVTPANAITGLRLLLAPVCVGGILAGTWWVAALAFSGAVASDLVDGPLARRRGEASALGGLLDHATDALFASSGLAALARVGLAPTPLPALVAAAFLQYALDSRALAGRPLRASALGRWNGIAYFVLLGVPLWRGALGLGWPGDTVVWAVGWGLVVSTALSMTDRLVALLRGPAPADPA